MSSNNVLEIKRSVPLLMDEPSLMVYPSLAVEMGINKAIVFQQLHFLLNGQKTARNSYNFIEEKWWVYNSYKQWKERFFPWLSESTIKGIFLELEQVGLILTKQGVKSRSDRRKWYTIDYDTWETTIGQKLSHHETKIIPSNGQKLSDDISENTKEVIKEEKDSPVPVVPVAKVEPTDDSADDQYLLLQDVPERLASLRNQVVSIKEPDERRNFKGYTKHDFYHAIERVFAFGCAVEGKKFGGYGLGTLCKWFHNEAIGRDDKPASLLELLDFMTWYNRETNGYHMPRERSRFVHWWGKWKESNPTVEGILAEFDKAVA